VLREVSDDLDREERRSRVVPVGFTRAAAPWSAPEQVVRPVAGLAPITPRRSPGTARPNGRPATPVSAHVPHAAVTSGTVLAAAGIPPQPVVAA